MGQKVNPIGLRLGVNRTWDSRWYASGTQFATLLHQDIKIRQFVREKLKAAGISKIIIERPLKKCRVTVHTAKPGVVIGKKGADIDYGTAEAKTTYGIIGIKCWIFKGEIMEHDPMAQDRRAMETGESRERRDRDDRPRGRDDRPPSGDRPRRGRRPPRGEEASSEPEA